MRQVRSILGPIFHVCFLSHHLYIFFHARKIHEALEKLDVNETDQNILDIKNFTNVYFTNWNLVLQTIYFSLAVFYDLLHLSSLYPKLKSNIDRWKGFLFTSLVFPSSIFVSATFWSLYSINREWILPEVCDEYLPGWLNHSIHTLVVVFVIIEVLIVNQLVPSFKAALIALTVLTVVYDVTFFITYFIYGRFIYGLFHNLAWPGRFGFFITNYLFSTTVMTIGIEIEKFKSGLSKRRTKKLKI